MSILKNTFRGIDKLIGRIASMIFRSEKNREMFRQFIKFSIIGVANTIIDFGIYTVMTRYIPFFDYRTSARYLANVVSFLTGTTFSFFANRTWTFEMDGRASIFEASRFYATTVSGLIVNSLILFLFAGLFGIHDLVSKVFSTIFSTIWNFSLKRLWVFAPNKNG